MTAVGVVLVWHWEYSAKIDQHRIIDGFSGSKCSNAHCSTLQEKVLHLILEIASRYTTINTKTARRQNGNQF